MSQPIEGFDSLMPIERCEWRHPGRARGRFASAKTATDTATTTTTTTATTRPRLPAKESPGAFDWRAGRRSPRWAETRFSSPTERPRRHARKKSRPSHGAGTDQQSRRASSQAPQIGDEPKRRPRRRGGVVHGAPSCASDRWIAFLRSVSCRCKGDSPWPAEPLIESLAAGEPWNGEFWNHWFVDGRRSRSSHDRKELIMKAGCFGV